jgi:hypothetical protein
MSHWSTVCNRPRPDRRRKGFRAIGSARGARGFYGGMFRGELTTFELADMGQTRAGRSGAIDGADRVRRLSGCERAQCSALFI